MTSTPVLPQVPKVTTQTFANADGTAWKTLFTGAAATGSKTLASNVTSDDTSARVIRVGILKGGSGTPVVLGSISVPAGSGYGGVTSVDLWSLVRALFYDADSNRCSYVANTDLIQGMMEVAVTAGKTVGVVTQAEDF